MDTASFENSIPTQNNQVYNLQLLNFPYNSKRSFPIINHWNNSNLTLGELESY